MQLACGTPQARSKFPNHWPPPAVGQRFHSLAQLPAAWSIQAGRNLPHGGTLTVKPGAGISGSMIPGVRCGATALWRQIRMGEFGIGQPVPREEDPYLVRG